MEATNRLAHEKSPYLLQHAHNPVAWHPWGEEAFARAREEDKPIFLSIGYSTCHWCHVMAHESFEDPETAAVMNELFVNVKVDREERPDVDRVYMTFVQATTGSGGWPMSVWLQPDLKPIVGGTYFPPDDRYGRRGFVSVCRSVADAWKNERAKVLAQGERIINALRAHTEVEASAVPMTVANRRPVADIMREALRPFASTFDPEYGGFGDAPKFPRPVMLTLLARIHARLAKTHPAESAQARDMMLATLDGMAAGGMHDHLGGGFHRYSVDRFWHVPHFEKMLYDQAQLAVAYLEAFQITGSLAYMHGMMSPLRYVLHDLTSPEGGYYCAEDADSLIAAGRPEHAEGAFYVWTKAEIEGTLNRAAAAEFCAYYGVQPSGNAPTGSDPQGEFTGKNILFARPGTAEEEANDLSESCVKMKEVRDQRPRPHLDDKIVTAWNGLMISAFARKYQVFGRTDHLESAVRAAGFIRKHLYQPESGVLLRTYREGAGVVEGFADDYAFLIQGLLDLYEAALDSEHIEWAEELQAKQDELFAAPGGGYFGTSERDASVLLRLREEHDGAEPAASSVAALNLARLAALTGKDDYRQRAEATVAAFGAAENPLRTAQTMPLMLAALDFLAQPPKQIVILAPGFRADGRALLDAVHHRFLPNKIVLYAEGDAKLRALAQYHPYLENATMQDGKATAYVCENGACQLPITDPAELARQLATH